MVASNVVSRQLRGVTVAAEPYRACVATAPVIAAAAIAGHVMGRMALAIDEIEPHV